jgi:nucleotide-binding universal stress UspA family protein
MPVTPCICGGIRQLPCISMRRVSVRCGTMVAGRIVPGMMIVFPVHMLPTMHGDLQRAANEQGRSAAELVRRALAAALEQHKLGTAVESRRGGRYRQSSIERIWHRFQDGSLNPLSQRRRARRQTSQPSRPGMQRRARTSSSLHALA